MMNVLSDRSPDMGPTQLAAGNAPPTPPHEDPLDDIYGSAPASPMFLSQDPQAPHSRQHEMLSDLPSRQRALDTDAYREGLSNSKGQYVQEGFDEGYSLGATIGLRAGYILGILQGFAAAWKSQDAQEYKQVLEVLERAQAELAIGDLLGQNWVNEQGIWTWEVKGKEDDPTLREVAEQHPVVQRWINKVEELALKYGVDLKAVEKHHGSTVEEGDA